MAAFGGTTWTMGYRIPKRGPKEYTIKVRLHPSDAHMVVSYFEGDDIPTILRAHARKHAPRMMRTLPLLLRTIVRKRDGLCRSDIVVT